ncbi:MAG: hypothetical protein AAGA30_16090, partial [Planctomycetota bacterium]
MISQQKIVDTKSKTKPCDHDVQADLPQLDFEMLVIDSPDVLEEFVGPWNRLVETAVRPNPFFDPDFLIPAVRYLGDKHVEVLVVLAKPRLNPGGAAVICGLLPIRKTRIYGLPLSAIEIWN